MAATLTEAQDYLTKLKAAYTAVISGQEYSVQTGGNSRRYKRNDIGILRSEMQYWEEYITKLQSGMRGIPIKFGTTHN